MFWMDLCVLSFVNPWMQFIKHLPYTIPTMRPSSLDLISPFAKPKPIPSKKPFNQIKSNGWTYVQKLHNPIPLWTHLSLFHSFSFISFLYYSFLSLLLALSSSPIPTRMDSCALGAKKGAHLHLFHLLSLLLAREPSSPSPFLPSNSESIIEVSNEPS